MHGGLPAESGYHYPHLGVGLSRRGEIVGIAEQKVGTVPQWNQRMGAGLV